MFVYTALKHFDNSCILQSLNSPILPRSIYLWQACRLCCLHQIGRLGPNNFWLVRSEHAHASYPELSFRPPGFNPHMGGKKEESMHWTRQQSVRFTAITLVSLFISMCLIININKLSSITLYGITWSEKPLFSAYGAHDSNTPATMILSNAEPGFH